MFSYSMITMKYQKTQLSIPYQIHQNVSEQEVSKKSDKIYISQYSVTVELRFVIWSVNILPFL